MQLNQTKYPWYSLSYDRPDCSFDRILDQYINSNDPSATISTGKREEITRLLQLLQESFKIHDIDFFNEDHKELFFNDICFCLVETLALDKEQNNSLSILLANDKTGDELKEISKTYHDIIKEIEEDQEQKTNYKATLSSVREWYINPEIYLSGPEIIHHDESKKSQIKTSEEPAKTSLFFESTLLERDVEEIEKQDKGVKRTKEEIAELIQQYNELFHKKIFEKHYPGLYHYIFFIPIGSNATIESRKNGIEPVILGATFIHFVSSRYIIPQRQIAGLIFQNVNSYWSSFLFSESIQNRQKKINQYALLAALAAVMARNMSHNIGSHVLPQFAQAYRQWFESLYNCLSTSRSTESILNSDTVKTNGQFLDAYLAYTQSRMELIADITIEQQQRVGFDYAGRIIRNNICDTFVDNKIGIGLIDGAIFKTKNNKYSIENSLSISIFPQNFDDKFISIPGGELGISALNLLLENIIRNYYKHSESDHLKGGINFSLVINEPNEPDNIHLKNDYWCVDFFDLHGNDNPNRAKEEGLIDVLNRFLDDKIIKHHTLRAGGWGFIEMKAAAAYLINFPFGYLEDSNYPTLINGKIFPRKIIEARYYLSSQGRREPSDKCLGYRFYLLKSKIAFIDETIVQEGYLKISPDIGIYVGNIFGDRNLFLNQFIVTDDKKKSTLQQQKCNQRIITSIPKKIINDLNLREELWNSYIAENKYENVVSSNKSYDDTSTNVILIDDHGGKFKEYDFEKAIRFKQNKLAAYFLACSKFESKLGDWEIGGGTDKRVLEAQLREAANIAITILDERIQRETDFTISDLPHLSVRELYELCNVYIPAKPGYKFGPLSGISTINLDKTSNNNIDALYDLVIQRLKSDEYVILHYSLFEKIAKRKCKDKKDFLNACYDDLKRDHVKHNRQLIFCSGRGRPSDLVKNCLYINFSTIVGALVHKPSKIDLIQVLKSLYYA